MPLHPVFRRLGIRTQREIELERYALKALRGDFDHGVTGLAHLHELILSDGVERVRDVGQGSGLVIEKRLDGGSGRHLVALAASVY